MAYKQKGWEAFSGAGDSPMKTYKKPRPQYSRKGELKKHGRGDVFHKDNVKLNVSEWGNLAKHGLKNNPVVNKNERKRQRNEVKKTLRGAFKKTDNDTDKMTKKEERKHRREVLKYNRKTAKPLNDTQKAKIREQLENMDPKDPEAKLLRKMLNLKKNR